MIALCSASTVNCTIPFQHPLNLSQESLGCIYFQSYAKDFKAIFIKAGYAFTSSENGLLQYSFAEISK